MNRKHSLNADARFVKPFRDTIVFDAGQFHRVAARLFPSHWSVWRRFSPSRSPRRTTALIGSTLRRSGRRRARRVAVRVRKDADLDGGGVPRRRSSASRCAAVH